MPSPSVVEFLPPLLVNSNLTKIRDPVGTFFWNVLLLWLLPLHVLLLILLFVQNSLSAWDATVDRARTLSPLWPACWLQCPDCSRTSASQEVRDIWDVYIREVGFVLFAVREHLFRLCNSPDVDSSWLLWSREAEASLARAYLSAGGPPLSNPSSYVGRGSLSIYTMRLGGRCHDRIYHVDRSDGFDVTHFGFFLNSSLAPALRFRRCFVSVCNGAVVRLDPTGPVTSFEPWTHWIPPDLHGFYKWAMDTLALLNEFVLKVVRHRQTSRSIAWSNWIREDLASRPYKWLRPEFVPPAPYLVCKPQDSPNGSGLLVQPALIDAHFRKAWMPYFLREGHPVVTVQAFLDFVVIISRRNPFWNSLSLLERSFVKLLWPKNLLLLVWMAGLGMKLKPFHFLGL